MELNDIRKNIDRIDQNLVQLFIERMECSKQVAQYKKEHSLPVFDAKREELLLDKVRKAAGSEYEQQIEKLYECLLVLSKDLQEKCLEGGK